MYHINRHKNELLVPLYEGRKRYEMIDISKANYTRVEKIHVTLPKNQTMYNLEDITEVTRTQSLLYNMLRVLICILKPWPMNTKLLHAHLINIV